MFTTNWAANLQKNLPLLYPSKPLQKMVCVEIGSFKGLGSLLIQNHLCKNKESQLYCVDHWEDYYGSESEKLTKYDKDFVGQYQRFVYNTKNVPNIIPLRGFSDDMIPLINEPVDFAYIDGDHSPNQTYKDAINMLPKMKKGGIILFDDYEFVCDGLRTKEGIDRFLNEYSSNIRVILRDYQLAVRVL